jgi:hypothetical protein
MKINKKLSSIFIVFLMVAMVIQPALSSEPLIPKTLKIDVIDDQGNMLNEAKVMLSDGTIILQRGLTANGEISFDIYNGVFLLEVSKENYESQKVRINADTTSDVIRERVVLNKRSSEPIVIIDPVEPRPRVSSLSVRVVDTPRNALPEATVLVYDATGNIVGKDLTSRSGELTFQELRAGAYIVEVHKEGYESNRERAIVYEREESNVVISLAKDQHPTNIIRGELNNRVSLPLRGNVIYKDQGIQVSYQKYLPSCTPPLVSGSTMDYVVANLLRVGDNAAVAQFDEDTFTLSLNEPQVIKNIKINLLRIEDETALIQVNGNSYTLSLDEPRRIPINAPVNIIDDECQAQGSFEITFNELYLPEPEPEPRPQSLFIKDFNTDKTKYVVGENVLFSAVILNKDGSIALPEQGTDVSLFVVQDVNGIPQIEKFKMFYNMNTNNYEYKMVAELISSNEFVAHVVVYRANNMVVSEKVYYYIYEDKIKEVIIVDCAEGYILKENICVEEEIPGDCAVWFDGCNTCRMGEDGSRGCTSMGCSEKQKPVCLEYRNIRPVMSVSNEVAIDYEVTNQASVVSVDGAGYEDVDERGFAKRPVESVPVSRSFTATISEGNSIRVGAYVLTLLRINERESMLVLQEPSIIKEPEYSYGCQAGCREVPEGCLCPKIRIEKTLEGYDVSSTQGQSINARALRIHPGSVEISAITDTDSYEVSARDLAENEGLRLTINDRGVEKEVDIFVDEAQLKTFITQGNQRAETRLTIISDQGNLKAEYQQLQRAINILPEEASQTARDALNTNLERMELRDNKGLLVYEAEAQQRMNILGIIPTTANVQTVISADTGEVLETNKPWYSGISSRR